MTVGRKLSMAALFVLAAASAVNADWLTFGHDPQRSGWAFEETAITPENAGTMALEWSVQLDNMPLSLTSLMPPLVARNIVTPQGVKTLVFVAGSSDHLFAVDAATGKVVWTRTFQTFGKPKAEAFFLCRRSRTQYDLCHCVRRQDLRSRPWLRRYKVRPVSICSALRQTLEPESP
jgi:glucose dehydrogenase